MQRYLQLMRKRSVIHHFVTSVLKALSLLGVSSPCLVKICKIQTLYTNLLGLHVECRLLQLAALHKVRIASSSNVRFTFSFCDAF